MAGAKPNSTGFKPSHQHRGPRPAKRPHPTHFLCLPLVNDVSLPQFETSISSFQAAYPPVPLADLPHSRDATVPGPSRPLIPHGAFRPVGTLHLTIGAMSLQHKDRLNEALSFFRSLDLRALMHEAERTAVELRKKQPASKDSPHGAHTSSMSAPSPVVPSDEFLISLESLHALPRAKTATVLHAAPVDPTGRLYPFCVMLRDKFIEAGFIVGEEEKKFNNKGTPTGQPEGLAAHPSTSMRNDAQPSSSCPDLTAENNASQRREEFRQGHPIITREPKLSPYEAALARKPKVRPLLLHATLVNTIYVRGRPKPKAGDGPKPKGGPKRIEFDATDILSKYRDYYIDESRAKPRCFSDLVQHNKHDRNSADKFPFVWANKIPIDSVCICEMGAKKLSLDDATMADPARALMNARLGEKYTVVAQRTIGSSEMSTGTRPIGQKNFDRGA